jgi:hypothetical protein
MAATRRHEPGKSRGPFVALPEDLLLVGLS